ncbi:arabinan endo-1,5-alpha-L-arabinosidase [Pontibacter diazotrophicus]|uniref:Arabinan endo-1,5-alpha-L-arabinosidase n=1 Tax=Pontibacter diazotrophicus TaxID=1400979 RepID=A0A3D8L6M3_9BACT|nr:arabinan endo-1,5-alpha-L-arabinosidase [Pontibacter diazotrophicus]RDV13048.1 arabinan endo-1,5-alpha-L-arabinosidase [Pontibacter diazotrophicus]
MKFACWLSFLLVLALQARAQDMQQNIAVHDPVMIKQDNTYYLFSTGRGIAVWSSKDMQNWKREEAVFSEAPAWAVEAVPTFKNHIWAPDISYYKDKYYLYYSVSAFGKNTSAIGLATNTTLNPTDENYKWVDYGKIIQSVPGETNWNAIDPNLITDNAGTPWLSFGSFWDGLKLVKLKEDRMSIAESTDNLPTIASRKKDAPAEGDKPVKAGGNAIEAPFIFKKNGYYYLFASIDYCCKGENSTYKMVVGRAKDVKGPYLDKEGASMAKGGGTLVLAGNKDWHGVGHNSVYNFDGKDYLVFHGYDASDKGKSKLRIEELAWDSAGWPEVAVE